MQTKLQELTEKIYMEGVNKAREESEKIIASASKEAEDIVNQARQQADDILKSAKRTEEELKKNSLNELQLSARQLISDTKQKIVNLLEAEAIKPEVKGAFKDMAFTQQVVMSLVQNWNPKGDEAVDLEVFLPEDKKNDFESFFKEKVDNLLQKGLEIKFSDKIKGGFKIGPKDGGYLISLTNEDFDNLFRSYLRPKLIEMLYTKQG